MNQNERQNQKDRGKITFSRSSSIAASHAARYSSERNCCAFTKWRSTAKEESSRATSVRWVSIENKISRITPSSNIQVLVASCASSKTAPKTSSIGRACCSTRESFTPKSPLGGSANCATKHYPQNELSTRTWKPSTRPALSTNAVCAIRFSTGRTSAKITSCESTRMLARMRATSRAAYWISKRKLI